MKEHQSRVNTGEVPRSAPGIRLTRICSPSGSSVLVWRNDRDGDFFRRAEEFGGLGGRQAGQGPLAHADQAGPWLEPGFFRKGEAFHFGYKPFVVHLEAQLADAIP